MRESLEMPSSESTAGSLILVVDDDHHDLFMLQRRLESHNYNVVTASSGKSAIEIAQERKPDLILLDMMMPEMDGLEVKEALNQNEETMNIPVIFLSHRLQIEYKSQAFDLGAEDFLAKPFHPEELLARIQVVLRHYLRQKQLIEEIQRLEEHMRTGGVSGVSEEEAMQRLDRAIQVAETRKEPLSVLHVKIDGLDKLNNPALVRVILMETSDVLQEMVNSSYDAVLAYREQGEYLLFVVGMQVKRAQILAEGLRSSLMVRAFSDPSAEENLTVSIGIAGRDAGSGLTPEDVLKGAEEAMRSALEAGGNRAAVRRLQD